MVSPNILDILRFWSYGDELNAFFQLPNISGDDDDVCALLSELPSNAEAHTLRATSDQNCLRTMDTLAVDKVDGREGVLLCH